MKRISFRTIWCLAILATSVTAIGMLPLADSAQARPMTGKSSSTKASHERVPAAIVKDIRTGYFHKALTRIKPMLAIHPDNPDYQYRYAQSLFGDGKNHEALRAIKKAISLGSPRASYYRVMGEIYGALAQNANVFSAMGLARHVLSSFRAAVKINPHDPRSLADLAKYYIDAPGIVGGNLRKAHEIEVDLEKIDLLDALKVRANEAVEAHSYTKAEILLRQAAGLDHSSHSARMLGFLYMRRHRYTDELKTFLAITKKHPNNVRAWYWVGRASTLSHSYYAEGIHAMKHYIGAPERPDAAPSLAFAYLRLGDLFRLTGKDHLACIEYAKAKKSHGAHRRKFRFDLGKALRKLRDSSPGYLKAITSLTDFSRVDCA